MERDNFAGIRPYVERVAATKTGVTTGAVDRIRQVKDLNNMLCQAVVHANGNRLDAARSAMNLAARYIDELDTALEAGRLAFAEVQKRIDPPVKAEAGDVVPPLTVNVPIDAETDRDAEAASTARRRRAAP
jgi:hypothetical protein